MYNNPFVNYNQQLEREKLDGQIAKLQQMREQLNQPVQPSINQTFQLAPQGGMKFANSIEEVNKDVVYVDTPYFSHDLSVLWLKNPKGNVKVFELNEIVQKDDKDMIIENLQMQINEMREEIKNAKSNIANVVKSDESEEPTSISSNRTSKKK